MEPRGTRLEASHEPIRDPLSGSLHAATSVRCLSTDFPTASVVRRKRRPPPWKSLATASHTEFRTLPRPFVTLADLTDNPLGVAPCFSGRVADCVHIGTYLCLRHR